MRTSSIERNTTETQIALSLNLDGSGKWNGEMNCGFLQHMMELFTRHGKFDLDLKLNGDVQVDYHHSAEDLGIVLGQAFKEALGDKKGLCRYGDIILPMDEVLMVCAVDISGRACLGYNVDIPVQKVGDFDTELVREFFLGFVRKAEVTLHFNMLAGENGHHIIEGMFKAFGRVMAKAVSINEAYRDELPSTKGVL